MDTSRKAILKLSGECAFSQGEKLLSDNKVVYCENNGALVSAVVKDGLFYHVSLNIRKEGYDASCQCSDNREFLFCKHCVAVGLHIEREKNKRAQLLRGNEADRVKAHLLSYSKSQLADLFIKDISKNEFLLKKWLLKADRNLAHDVDVDVSKIYSQLNKALPLKKAVKSDEVDQYLLQAETLIEEIIDDIIEVSSELRLSIAQKIFERLNQVSQRVAFDREQITYLYSLMTGEITRSFVDLSWSDNKRFDFLYKQILKELTVYPNIVSDFFFDDLSRTNFIEFCKEKFIHLSNIAHKANAQPKDVIAQKKLGLFLLNNLENESCNESDELILLIKERLAKGYFDYIELVEIYLQQDKVNNAKKWFVEIQGNMVPESHKFAYQRIHVDVYRLEKKYGEAIALQWKIFYETKQYSDYLRLKDLDEASVDQIYNNARDYLLGFSNDLEKIHANPNHPIIDFYLCEGEIHEAVAFAKCHCVSSRQLEKMAYLLLTLDLKASLSFIFRAVSIKLENQTKRAYTDTVNLLIEFKDTLENDQRSQICKEDRLKLFKLFIDEIRLAHQSKLSFIHMIDEYFNHSL